MDDPYRSPSSVDVATPSSSRRRWRRICLRSLTVGLVGFLGTLFYPPQLFFEPDMRMLPLGLLSLAMYVGGIVAIVAGVKWARAVTGESAETPKPGSHF